MAGGLRKPAPPRRSYRPGRWESFEPRRRSPNGEWVALTSQGNVYYAAFIHPTRLYVFLIARTAGYCRCRGYARLLRR